MHRTIYNTLSVEQALLENIQWYSIADAKRWPKLRCESSPSYFISYQCCGRQRRNVFRYHHLYKLRVAVHRHYKRMMQKTFLHMDIYSLAAVEKKICIIFFSWVILNIQNISWVWIYCDKGHKEKEKREGDLEVEGRKSEWRWRGKKETKREQKAAARSVEVWIWDVVSAHPNWMDCNWKQTVSPLSWKGVAPSWSSVRRSQPLCHSWTRQNLENSIAAVKTTVVSTFV